ncbi:MAG: hypothetical protein LBJ00_05960, partial [Planctomycetaceae bacterium]|nr:hypothetical protein [Planctomycetaceae bacterium]
MKKLKEIDDGYQAWNRNLQFKCNYTYTEGVASTEEEAKLMLISKCEKITLKISGQIAKSKSKTLLSQVVEFDSYSPLQTQGYIAVINETLEVHYVACNGKKTLDTLSIMERKVEDMMLCCPRVPQSPTIKPFNYSSLSILELLEKLQKIVAVTHPVLKVFDDGTIEVSYGYKGQSGINTDASIKYSILGKYPIPTENRISVEKSYYQLTVVRDFITGNDKMVIPTTIVSYSGPMKDWRGKEYEGKWLVREWKAENVTSSGISDRDFFIPLNKDTHVGGLTLDLSKEIKKNMP